MTINTGISASLRRPQTFHKHVYLKSGRSLVALEQRVALIGISAGTAVAGTVVALNDPEETDTLFGTGTELALMARKAFEVIELAGGGPSLFAVPMAAPGASVAAADTFTATGTATAGGTVHLKIGGRSIFVGVAVGDVQNTVALAIQNAIRAQYENLPVTAVAAANVVTMTNRTTGENGNDVVFEIVSHGGVTGCVVTTASTVVGTGVTDITTSLDALATMDYDGIAISNHKAADIADINAHITAMWVATEKKWRWVFVGEAGSIGTATALAAAANHQGVLVGSLEGTGSMPYEIAAALAVQASCFDRPNANFNGMRLPLYPPAAATAYTTTEVETAIGAGLTPLTPVFGSNRVIVDGVVKIERMITTKTTEGGFPFDQLRDLAVSRVGAYMARQIDVGYAARFGNNPDALLDDEVDDQIGDMVINMMYDAQDLRILRNVDADKSLLQVEPDGGSPGRVNVDLTYTTVLPLHQAAFVHRVTI